MVAATTAAVSKSSKTMDKSILSSSSKGRVDPALVERAVAALMKYHTDQQGKQTKGQLLGSDSVMHVQFGLTVGPERPSLKPIAIPLPHAICKMVRGGDDDSNSNDDDDDDGLEEAEVCLIVKQESKPWVQEMIGQFPQYMGNVKKVLGLDSLRKKHASPQQRRDLCARYTLFLCDDRILPLMKNALGKEFIAKKKYPLPVDLTRQQHLPLAIFQSLRSTFMHLKDGGCCVSIYTGTTGMAPHKLVANVLSICENAVPRMPRKWANVQSICLSTPESVGLPIYNKIPAELDEISKMAGLPSIWKSAKELEDEDSDDEKNEKEEGQKRKRKELAAKSPLVRALKQQKKEEKKEPTGSSSKSTEKQASSLSSKSNKKKRSDDDDVEKEATPKSHRKDKEFTAKGSAAKKSKTDNKTKVDTDTAATKDDDKAPKEKKKKDSFIQASKFKGSKKGYIFTKGKHGLGYYLDMKPVVDKLAIEALVRMGTARQQRGGGGGSHKKSGKKGRRSGGGGGNRRRSY